MSSNGDSTKLPRADFQLPRCRRCGDDRLRILKTQRVSDRVGVFKTRLIECSGCGHRFVGRFT